MFAKLMPCGLVGHASVFIITKYHYFSVFSGVGEEGPAEGAPKMEDFLGGLGGGGGAVAVAPAAAPEDQLSCGELGSIAAGFLRRYPAPENAGGVTIAMATDAAAELADPARRTAETFGQRTSIYRGVTRYIYFAITHGSIEMIYLSNLATRSQLSQRPNS